jgi:hypothetical protein
MLVEENLRNAETKNKTNNYFERVTERGREPDTVE